MTHAAPYKILPKVMTVGLVMGSIKLLNAFPSATGVSKTMSPATIVLGLPKPNMKYKRIVFGSNALVYTGTNNNMDARSMPAIALNSSNEHGGHYFMSLYSGKRIHSYEWKELPIDEDVIDRVEELAETEEAPEMKRGYLIFTWKQRVLHDLELIDEDRIIDDTSELEEQINEAEDENVMDNNNNDEGEQVIVINDKEDEGHIIFEENKRENNYVTDEGSIMNEQNEEE